MYMDTSNLNNSVTKINTLGFDSVWSGIGVLVCFIEHRWTEYHAG